MKKSAIELAQPAIKAARKRTKPVSMHIICAVSALFIFWVCGLNFSYPKVISIRLIRVLGGLELRTPIKSSRSIL